MKLYHGTQDKNLTPYAGQYWSNSFTAAKDFAVDGESRGYVMEIEITLDTLIGIDAGINIYHSVEKIIKRDIAWGIDYRQHSDFSPTGERHQATLLMSPASIAKISDWRISPA